MTFDVAQAMLVVKLFMDRPSAVPHSKIINTAMELMQRRKSLDQSKIDSIEDKPSIKQVLASSLRKSIDSSLYNRIRAQPEYSRLVAQALGILQTAESILLIEYVEVAIPLMYGVFISIASQLMSANCSRKLRVLHDNPDARDNALWNMNLYAFLQALSLVLVVVVIAKRYNMAPWTHLAFTLEHHWWSLQGNMLPWVVIICHFPLVHYGKLGSAVTALHGLTESGRDRFLVAVRLHFVSWSELPCSSTR